MPHTKAREAVRRARRDEGKIVLEAAPSEDAHQGSVFQTRIPRDEVEGDIVRLNRMAAERRSFIIVHLTDIIRDSLVSSFSPETDAKLHTSGDLALLAACRLVDGDDVPARAGPTYLRLSIEDDETLSWDQLEMIDPSLLAALTPSRPETSSSGSA